MTLGQLFDAGVRGQCFWAACRVVDLAAAGGELLGVNAAQTDFGNGSGQVGSSIEGSETDMANQWLQSFWSADEASQVAEFDDLPSGYKRIYCDYSPDLATWPGSAATSCESARRTQRLPRRVDPTRLVVTEQHGPGRAGEDPTDRGLVEMASPADIDVDAERPRDGCLDRRDVRRHHDHLVLGVDQQLLRGGDDAVVHLLHGLATADPVVRVGAPGRPDVVIDIGKGHAIEVPEVELDPTLVDLVRHPERFGGLAGPHQWRADHSIGLAEPSGDTRSLRVPDIVEREVEQALQLSSSVCLSATMTNEHQHPNSESDRETRQLGGWLHQQAMVDQRASSVRIRELASSPHPRQQRSAGNLERDVRPPPLQ